MRFQRRSLNQNGIPGNQLMDMVNALGRHSATKWIFSIPKSAFADDDGTSFWIPGFFGSLAAASAAAGMSADVDPL
jgi:hypothetical protein